MSNKSKQALAWRGRYRKLVDSNTCARILLHSYLSGGADEAMGDKDAEEVARVMRAQHGESVESFVKGQVLYYEHENKDTATAAWRAVLAALDRTRDGSERVRFVSPLSVR